MSEKTVFHILTLRDLKSHDCYARWSDPDAIAPPSPQKRQTMLSNPAGRDDEPAQILATQGEQIVGRMDLIPGEVTIDGKRSKIVWASNLYVPEVHRSSLAGLLLIMKSHGVHDTVGVVGVSKQAHEIYKKLNWIDRIVPRFMMIRRSRSVIEKYVGAGIHARLGACFVDFGLAAYRALWAPIRLLSTRGLRVERLASMPRGTDALLARPRERVATSRSSAIVNWLIENRFTGDSRDKNQLYCVLDATPRAVAYFVTKVRFHESASHRGFKNVLLGSLQDWVIFDQRAIDFRGIVHLAVRSMCRLRVDAIEICTDDPEVHPMLKRMGFLRVGELHMMFKLSKNSPLTAAEFADVTQWRIRPADGDNFFA